MQDLGDELARNINFTRYDAGYYTTFIPNFITSANSVKAQNQITGYISYLDKTVSVDEVILSIQTGAVGTGVVGIYKFVSRGAPLKTNWELVAQTAEFNSAITGVQGLAINATLTPGIYAFVTNQTAATITYNGFNIVNLPAIFGAADGTSTTAAGLAAGIRKNVTYNSVLPASLNDADLFAGSGTYQFLRFKIA